MTAKRLKKFSVTDVKDLIDSAAEVISSNGMPVVGRRMLAEQFDNTIIIDVFLAVLNYYPVYESKNAEISRWKCKVHDSLLEYIIVSVKSKDHCEEFLAAESEEPSAVTELLKNGWSQPSTLNILKALMRIETKFALWKLVERVIPLRHREFFDMVMEEEAQGTARYHIINKGFVHYPFKTLLSAPQTLFPEPSHIELIYLLPNQSFCFRRISFWDIDIFLTAIEERKSDTVIREDKREYVVENCKIMVYTVLIYIIRRRGLNRYLQDPSLLFTVALLGPLSASDVENFASERSLEFREECRRIVFRLESCTLSTSIWEAALAFYCRLKSFLGRTWRTVMIFCYKLGTFAEVSRNLHVPLSYRRSDVKRKGRGVFLIFETSWHEEVPELCMTRCGVEEN
ncbi:unnamed protein product [Enterobius vermicularis]|uniref:Uncharacterized protein n=1 Tax=Enterobius vermicularis TaxID=51028 RepID=A0A0N4UXB1_ENTVE|nr:unnamed protein product [Enterobius vermicularis]